MCRNGAYVSEINSSGLPTGPACLSILRTRSFFIYPRLISAMYVGLREMGIHRLYAAVRRQQIAEAHLKIGFKKIGDMAVLAKPLRPALLFAKYKKFIRREGGQRFLRALCSVPDAVVGLGVRFQGLNAATPWEVSEVPSVSDELPTSPASTNKAMQDRRPRLGVSSCFGRATRERVRIIDCSRTASRQAACCGDRSDGRACRRDSAAVILDLIHEPNSDHSAKMVLAGVERLALASGCEGVLLLDGLSSDDARLVRSRAYLKSPEKYSLLMWTNGARSRCGFPRISDLGDSLSAITTRFNRRNWFVWFIWLVWLDERTR